MDKRYRKFGVFIFFVETRNSEFSVNLKKLRTICLQILPQSHRYYTGDFYAHTYSGDYLKLLTIIGLFNYHLLRMKSLSSAVVIHALPGGRHQSPFAFLNSRDNIFYQEDIYIPYHYMSIQLFVNFYYLRYQSDVCLLLQNRTYA